MKDKRKKSFWDLSYEDRVSFAKYHRTYTDLMKKGSQSFGIQDEDKWLNIYTQSAEESGEKEYCDSRIARFLARELVKRNKGDSFSDCLKLNLVDYTNISEEELVSLGEKLNDFVKEEGVWAALPPFEKGMYVDDSNSRYFEWLVTDVDQDMSYFDMNIRAYSKGPTTCVDIKLEENPDECFSWVLYQNTDVRIHMLNKDEFISMNYFHPDMIRMFAQNEGKKYDIDSWLDKVGGQYDSFPFYVGGTVLGNEDLFPAMKEKILKGKFFDEDGILNRNDIVKALDKTSSILYNDLQSFGNLHYFCCSLVCSFTHLNYMLQNKSASQTYGRTVENKVSDTIMDSATQNRKERFFGGIGVVSTDKPRRITKENITRVYKTLAWNRRSHVRHLKSGKTVVVKSAVCHRDVDKQPEVTPQTIYKGR